MTPQETLVRLSMIHELIRAATEEKKRLVEEVSTFLALGEKAESTLPDGSVIGVVSVNRGTTTGGLSVTDEEVFLDWVLANDPDVVRTVQIVPDWYTTKENISTLVERYGELPPGVTDTTKVGANRVVPKSSPDQRVALAEALSKSALVADTINAITA